MLDCKKMNLSDFQTFGLKSLELPENMKIIPKEEHEKPYSTIRTFFENSNKGENK